MRRLATIKSVNNEEFNDVQDILTFEGALLEVVLVLNIGSENHTSLLGEVWMTSNFCQSWMYPEIKALTFHFYVEFRYEVTPLCFNEGEHAVS